MQNRIHIILVVSLFSLLLSGCEKPVSFKKDIQPVLKQNCLQCHDGKGEGSTASGFSVQSYDSVMQGTKYGPVVVPGSAVGSTLYRIVTPGVDPSIQMPPQHEESLAEGRGKPLDDVEIRNLELWIDQGAKDN